jgi:hypothetical protein
VEALSASTFFVMRFAKYLTALLLVAATVAVWQFRFTHAGPPITRSFEPGLSTWEWTSARKGDDPKDGIVTLSRSEGESDLSLETNLGLLDGARFLHLQMESRWTDVAIQEKVRWATARAVVFGRGRDGGIMFPRDHGFVAADGTRDWHWEEGVLDLPPDLGEVWFALQHFATKGSFEARNLSISVVRQRAWFPAAAAALTCLWIAWGSWLLAPRTRAWRWTRGILAGTVLVSATWVLVFPQPRFLARPLLGKFQLGAPVLPTEAVPSLPPPPPSFTPEAPPSDSPQQTPPATHPPPQPELPSPLPSAEESAPRNPEPEPEQRAARTVESQIRAWKDRFNFLHFAAFAGFGFLLFLFAGRESWPVAALVASASEALPNYQLHQPWDTGDLTDLTLDAAGLLVAYLMVRSINRWWTKRADASSDREKTAPAPTQ